MKKLLVVLAVVLFTMTFTVPAMARPPTAMPATTANDQVISDWAVSRGTIVPTTIATAINGIRVLTATAMAANHRTLLAEMWVQVALDANNNYHGRCAYLPGALIMVSDEETSRISARVLEDVSVTLTGNQTLMILAGHNPTATTVSVDVTGLNDLMVQGSRHGQANSEYDPAGNITLINACNIRHENVSLMNTMWTVQDKDGTMMIQVRSISAIPLCPAPVALKANECTFGQERQEQQRAAMHYDLTNTCTVTAIRMDNAPNTGGVGTVLRL